MNRTAEEALQEGCLIKADWPAPANVMAYCTTRIRGVSSAPFDGFNLALHVDDDVDAVQCNRAKLAGHLGCSRIQWLDQVHGCEVVEPDSNLQVLSADGLYTTLPKVACAVLTADCLPVFFCSRSGAEIAIAHAGWRGLSGGILERTLDKFSCSADQILCWLGPAIGAKHFQVGEEVRRAFQNQPLNSACFVEQAVSAAVGQHSLRWYADLYELARLRLNARGVGQIWGGDFCTYADSKRFYSYRREGVTGRMASVLLLREPCGS